MKKRPKPDLSNIYGRPAILLPRAVSESTSLDGKDGMNRRVTILATLHELQGAERRDRSVHDPMYTTLLNQLITTEGIDFIFEEASGWGPTIAEKLARDRLGPDRYLDVDPRREERAKFGIPPDSNDSYMIGSPPSAAFAYWQFHQVHARREDFWLQQLAKQQFKSALMVCGLAHVLSFAFRLQAANFSVKALEYANWQHQRPLNTK